jgi:hypothetical protein
MYADDLVLLAPSVHALETLLKVCDIFADNNDIMYNTGKTVCMLIQPKSVNISNPRLVLSGNVLKCVTSHKYLGFELTTDRKDEQAISHQCRNLYSRGNMLIRNFKTCSDTVKCQLFQSFCTNFYCSPLWINFSHASSLERFKVAYNRVFRILMNFKHRTSMSASFINRGMSPFSVIIRKSIGSFRRRILDSSNILIKTIAESMYFMFCTLTVRWNNILMKLRE